MKKSSIALIIIVITLILSAQSLAGLIDWERRNQYLKDQAAKGDSAKQELSKDLPQWMQVEQAVVTPEEKKFDVNRDGKFQPSEAKIYLRRVYEDTQEGKGSSIQNSQILKEYDANRDGIISRTDAQKIKKDAF